VDAATPAAITRRHLLEEHSGGTSPFLSVIGGKLTTCRSLAEETAAKLLGRLGREARTTSRDRLIPGAEDWPADLAALEQAMRTLAERHGCSGEQVATLWRLCGTRVRGILAEINGPWESLDGTSMPRAFARWVIEHEWVRTLDDLVERRLLLLYHHPLTATCLRQLAELLAAAGLLDAARIDQQVAESTERLEIKYGKRVV
jgi:glycerol-3-phosphate dehydrogenase